MPKLSVWAIRLSLIYLVAGWSVGAGLMLNRAWGWSAQLWTLLPIHAALVTFGWIFLLVIGVAYRMLPKFSAKRGRPVAAWTSVAAVNVGVWWVAAGIVFTWAVPLVAAICWLVAALAFAWHAWPRVKPFGKG